MNCRQEAAGRQTHTINQALPCSHMMQRPGPCPAARRMLKATNNWRHTLELITTQHSTAMRVATPPPHAWLGLLVCCAATHLSTHLEVSRLWTGSSVAPAAAAHCGCRCLQQCCLRPCQCSCVAQSRQLFGCCIRCHGDAAGQLWCEAGAFTPAAPECVRQGRWGQQGARDVPDHWRLPGCALLVLVSSVQQQVLGAWQRLRCALVRLP